MGVDSTVIRGNVGGAVVGWASLSSLVDPHAVKRTAPASAVAVAMLTVVAERVERRCRVVGMKSSL